MKKLNTENTKDITSLDVDEFLEKHHESRLREHKKKIRDAKRNQGKSIKEAIRRGNAGKMVPKMIGVINRRTGRSFEVSPVSTEFANPIDSFAGFFAYDGSQLIRINFLLSDSDHVNSIDLFGEDLRKPEETIDLNGFNIVQVIEMIADVLTGEFFQYAESETRPAEKGKLEEARKMKDRIHEWLDQNPNIEQDITRLADPDYRSYLESFNDFSEQRGEDRYQNYASFVFSLKKALENRSPGSGEHVPAVSVRSGEPENPIDVDPELRETFNAMHENIHLVKFEMLRVYMQEIAKGNPDFRSCYVYGMGGIGKSHWAKKILKPLENTEYYAGNISGYTGLLELLYRNRDDKIIVMDDIVKEQDMKASMENILKSALDPAPPRRIQLIRQEDSKSAPPGAIILNEEESRELDKLQLQEEDEILIDMTSDEGVESKSDFAFNSVVVFLTNIKRVPQPLQDRCWTLEMIFNNQQVSDLIQKTLIDVEPEASSEDLSTVYNFMDSQSAEKINKQTVLDFMKEVDAANITNRTFSYRLFSRCLCLYMATKHTDDWKKFIMIEMGN